MSTAVFQKLLAGNDWQPEIVACAKALYANKGNANITLIEPPQYFFKTIRQPKSISSKRFAASYGTAATVAAGQRMWLLGAVVGGVPTVRKGWADP
ncbi:MAG: hypothetical protein ABSB88_12855 [Bryobacteraceae bacterium]|jgi:hypothetical protein